VFPRRIISDEVARLVATLNDNIPNSVLLGIGMDIETGRSVNPKVARFFLLEGEEPNLLAPKTLLRLWTVKEAIFKADRDNRETVLGDYIVENPSEWTGTAYRRDRKLPRFYYSSIELHDGFLSVAVLKGEPHG